MRKRSAAAPQSVLLLIADYAEQHNWFSIFDDVLTTSHSPRSQSEWSTDLSTY